MAHREWNLLDKTELRIEGIGLDGANLSDLAQVAAATLGLAADEVYVIDARDRLLTFDVLRSTVDPYQLVGRQEDLLESLKRLPGVLIDGDATVQANGMLGWISEDAETGRAALDRSRSMVDEIERRIASRALVISTGNEVVTGQIQDTNKPWALDRLRIAGYRPAPGPDLPDNTDQIAAVIREAAEERGFGLIITTGGVGAESKDGTVEALLQVCPGAHTPYLFSVRQGHGRHAKPGVRIGLGEVAGSLVVCLPGPHAEATLGIDTLLDGLAANVPLPVLAESIAQALRARLRAHGGAGIPQ